MELPEDMKAIFKRWKENSSQNRIAATFEKENELKLLKIIPNRTWPKIWKNCPFLVPEHAKNAKMINEILVASWETQTSFCPSLPLEHGGQAMDWLMTECCFKIHGFLIYYFKSLGKYSILFDVLHFFSILIDFIRC